MSGHLFKAVVQAVLLLRAETWVLNPRMERDLSSFRHRVARGEQKAPCHRPVFQGGGVEEEEASVGRTAGELGESLSGLWSSFGKCDGVQVSGKGDGGKRL